ncbi:MAG: hypothetical protein AAGA81_16555 [Acidobacteriota bacterium]
MNIHGRIEYRSLSVGAITGDETFRIEQLREGGKRLEAVCQLLDREIERRVELEVDPSFAPLSASVWSRQGGSPPEHARYRFGPDVLVVETLNVDDGDPDDLSRQDFWDRVEHPVSTRLDSFIPHPLIADGWQSGSHPGPGGPPVHTYMTASSTPQEDGSGGLEAVIVPRTLEFAGAVRLEPPVLEETEALHYRMLCSRPDWEPMEVLVRARDRLLLRASWPVLDAYYELVEYEERTPSHVDGQGLPIVRSADG